MENFYFLDKKVQKGDLFINEYSESDEFDEHFAEGKPIESPEKMPQLYYDSKQQRKTDYLAGVMSFPVVSHRFKEILLQFEPSHLAFHPIQLIYKKTNEVDTSYSFMNILNHCACFDWEKSVFETYSSTEKVISRVYNLVIKPEAMQNSHIVRIKELRTIILLSARLKEEIEKSNLLGIDFMKLENYRK
ncbi:Imm43 family immunity protein [Hugenholtzia roseola]|uniref:Imm43 family immunity protein n=1 Tax=Hugenholtzia roseola TaxID=1002 RepID=UPI0004228CF8|nr:DUF1629 domain-containing protein [Hugenholtzia roseola]